MSTATHHRPSKAPEARSVVLLARGRLTDPELVRGLMHKDPNAVAELYDRHAELVRRVFIRALGSATDVDDAVQDTFIMVLRRISTLRDPACLKGFVVGVTIRLAKNEMRRRALRRWVGLDEIPEPPVSADADESTRESVRQVYAALERLDAASRVLFVLRHVEGLELTELAEATGCSLATVKRRLARAETRFEAIAEHDPVLRSHLWSKP